MYIKRWTRNGVTQLQWKFTIMLTHGDYCNREPANCVLCRTFTRSLLSDGCRLPTLTVVPLYALCCIHLHAVYLLINPPPRGQAFGFVILSFVGCALYLSIYNVCLLVHPVSCLMFLFVDRTLMTFCPLCCAQLSLLTVYQPVYTVDSDC